MAVTVTSGFSKQKKLKRSHHVIMYLYVLYRIEVRLYHKLNEHCAIPRRRVNGSLWNRVKSGKPLTECITIAIEASPYNKMRLIIFVSHVLSRKLVIFLGTFFFVYFSGLGCTIVYLSCCRHQTLHYRTSTYCVDKGLKVYDRSII